MASHSQRGAERLVVGITGRIGAGKTSAAKYLNTTRGFQYLRYSQVLAEWQTKDSERKAHLQEVGWEVMAGGMQQELNRRLIAQIRPDNDAAVDGLRDPIDFKSLAGTFVHSFRLLYIESSPEDRWRHLEGRGRYKNFGEFQGADSHPVEQRIEYLREKAALVITNQGSLQDLFNAVGEAVIRFRKER